MAPRDFAQSSGEAGDKEVRFGFGENWRLFLNRLDEGRIAEAEKSLRAMLGVDRLENKTFLDIGSGSGLFSLAARRLGATVHSFDFDPNSVACTQSLRDRLLSGDPNWTVQQGSVLDAAYVESLGKFDIVYSWGVLHHTGAMYPAIEQAASAVKAGGLFAFALYRKTRLCWAWTIEKRWYTQASLAWQERARGIYRALLSIALMVKGLSIADYAANYRSNRGMDFENDLHDWMGGYPYESITPEQAENAMRRLGFQRVSSNVRPYEIGFFGSGCDEFCYRRL